MAALRGMSRLALATAFLFFGLNGCARPRTRILRIMLKASLSVRELT
jgi:hypothetical protein